MQRQRLGVDSATTPFDETPVSMAPPSALPKGERLPALNLTETPEASCGTRGDLESLPQESGVDAHKAPTPLPIPMEMVS